MVNLILKKEIHRLKTRFLYSLLKQLEQKGCFPFFNDALNSMRNNNPFAIQLLYCLRECHL